MTALKTLFIPMQDYAADIEDETNRWFDRDHVPERLSCEGFLGCERFQLTDIQPAGWTSRLRWYKYLNMYSVQSPSVLNSEAYRLQTTQPPGRWVARNLARDEAAGMGDLYSKRFTARRWSIRSLWSQRPSTWPASTVSMPPPRALYVVLRDVDPAHEEAFNRFQDEEAVAELLTCPGFLRCERYEISSESILPMPGEQASLDQPRYMDVYDIETPEIVTNPVFWNMHCAPSERAIALAPHVTVRGIGVYMQRPSPWALRPV
jgi:hypothetical protein